jgi:glucose/arabinose dehydrogenase
MWRFSAFTIALLLVLTACTCTEGAPQQTATPGPTPTETPPSEPVADAVIVENLNTPWGLAFADDGAVFLAERDTGRILLITEDGEVQRIKRLSSVRAAGEGGLLGLAFAEGQLFAYFTSASDNRVVRMSWDGQRLGEPEVILSGIPKGFTHNGGRMRIGPEGALYIGTGDAGEKSESQNLTSLAGKILRITLDGDPWPDNPLDDPVFSLGHRNVQGLDFWNGQLVASEFGQNAWDELNLVNVGSNGGWPEVEGSGEAERFLQPLVTWRPAEASPSGVAVIGNFAYVASLRGSRLWRVDLTSGESKEFFVGEFGRLRTIERAPDGSLWLITSNTDGRGDPGAKDDRIIRVKIPR